jgi:hypothetical protein
MLRRLATVLPASLVLLLLGVADARAADGACEGTISSQALKPLPADAAFDVEIYDNSEENLELRQRLLDALREAGRATAEGGPLMITVISESLFPRYRPDIRTVGNPTTQATTDQLGINRQRSTIENLEFAPDDDPNGGSRRFEEHVEVRLEVRDARTRQFVWLAQLSCAPLTDNRSLIVDAVLAAFTANVGQTVTDAPF